MSIRARSLLPLAGLLLAACSSADSDSSPLPTAAAESATTIVPDRAAEPDADPGEPLEGPTSDGQQPGDDLDVIISDDPTDLASIDPATLVDCDGEQFPIGALIDQVSVGDSDVPGLADALESFMQAEDAKFVAGEEASLAAGDWLLLGVSDDRANILFDAGHSITTMDFTRNDDSWSWSGSKPGGSCDITTALPDGLSVVTWKLDPRQAPPGPDDTSFTVLATEQACSSQDNQLLGPQIVETDTTVLIAFALIAQVDICVLPVNPATPVTIELDAPLGDRILRDGLSIAPDIRTFLG